MSRNRKELYDLANNFYLEAKIQLVEHHPTFKRYEVKYRERPIPSVFVNGKIPIAAMQPGFIFPTALKNSR